MNKQKKQPKINPKVLLLKQYTDLIKELDLLMESYFTLRLKLMSPKIQHLKQDLVQTSIEDTTTENLAEMCDLESCIESRRKDIVKTRIELEGYIKQVPESGLRVVLINRYVNGWNWEKVATQMNYSWKQIHRLHSEALNYITIKNGKTTHNDIQEI